MHDSTFHFVARAFLFFVCFWWITVLRRRRISVLFVAFWRRLPLLLLLLISLFFVTAGKHSNRLICFLCVQHISSTRTHTHARGHSWHRDMCTFLCYFLRFYLFPSFWMNYFEWKKKNCINSTGKQWHELNCFAVNAKNRAKVFSFY